MENHTIQPLLNQIYPKAQTAKGIYIFDQNGKRYLDGSSGAMNCSIGHSHPKILPSIKEQLNKLQYVYRTQFGSDESEKLAEKLWQISPDKEYYYSFFVNSGSEAVESAMKITLQYWQELGYPAKRRFISRRKSYHGITMGALSVTGHPARRARFEKSLNSFDILESDLEESSLEDQREELIRVIRETGKNRIAGLIAEPIVGAAGTALIPQPGYYEMVKGICDENQILIIADEILAGMGRTGSWFAMDHWSCKADIVVIGKCLGAGYAPIAAVMLKEEILDPIKKGSGLIMSGHTYSAHPLSCFTATRVIEIIEEDRLLSNVKRMGSYLLENLKYLKGEFSEIEIVRGKGMLFGIEFDPGIKSLQSRLVDKCFDNGLLVYPSAGGKSGWDENGILIAPPFIITNEQVDELIEKFKKSLQEVLTIV